MCAIFPDRYPLDPDVDPEEASRALHIAYLTARDAMDSTDEKFAALITVMHDLRDPINRFFADVLVMVDDPALRQSRLGLVQHIAALPDGIVDLSAFEGF